MDNPKTHRRRPIRLSGYDYQSTGAYFLTLCTQNRQCLFGEIAGGEIVLNDAGRMVHRVWNELPLFYPGVDIDAFQIMPNHFHGIILLVGAGPRACPTPDTGQPQGNGQPRGVALTGWNGRDHGNTTVGLSLPDVVHRFKTMTTKIYVDGVKQSGWPAFPGKLWQRNYYERIVRDADEMVRLQQYVLDNPQKWEYDRENPQTIIRKHPASP